MRIAPIQNQQLYSQTQTFQGKKGLKGGIIGGLAGAAICGAMIATYPFDWRQVKTWPIVGVALTTAGALNGKLIEDTFDKKNKKD